MQDFIAFDLTNYYDNNSQICPVNYLVCICVKCLLFNRPPSVYLPFKSLPANSAGELLIL